MHFYQLWFGDPDSILPMGRVEEISTPILNENIFSQVEKIYFTISILILQRKIKIDFSVVNTPTN